VADPNADDGDRNFAPGIISNRFDLYSQLDFSKGRFGFDASARAWYDHGLPAEGTTTIRLRHSTLFRSA